MKQLVYLLVSISILQAAFEFRYSGARSDALAGSYTAIAEGVEGAIFNPASLGYISRREISAYYSYLYSSLGSGLKHLSLMTGPFKFLKGSFSISILRLSASFDNWGTYAENTVVFSHGIQVSDRLLAGVSLNIYYLQNPGDLGNALAFGFDMGLLARIYDRWKMGIMVHNLNNPSLEAEGGREELPLWLSAGVSYRIGKYSLTSVDFRKSRDHDLRVSIGEEVKIADYLKVRAGVLNEGDLFRFSSGFGTTLGRFGLDYAIVFNPDLPLTHTLSFRFVL